MVKHKSLILVLVIACSSLIAYICYFNRVFLWEQIAASFETSFNTVHAKLSPTEEIIRKYSDIKSKLSSTNRFTVNELNSPKRSKNTVFSEVSIQNVTFPEHSQTHKYMTDSTTIKAPQQCVHNLPNIKLTIDNQFLYHAICSVHNHTSIVAFRGRRQYTSMGLDFDNPHIVIHGKNNIKMWSDLARQVNEIHDRTPPNKAVHVHNELKIGDFLHFILKEHLKRLPKVKGRPKPTLSGILNTTTMQIQDAMDQRQVPIVLSNSVDENWGFLSTCITNRSTCWINMTNHLLIHNANYETVHQVLESDKIALLLSNTHVDPLIGAHPKILCLPLGLKANLFAFTRAMAAVNTQYKKTRLLLINNSGWGNRALINEMVSTAFNGTVKNTYSSKRSTAKIKFKDWSNGDVWMENDHYQEIIQSKFVLCPSGLGYDTYRLWETLLLGAIPIVESNAGMDRTYSSLPVLVISNYAILTPTLLNEAWLCFSKHIDKWKYEHLTQQYWRDLVSTAIRTGSIEHVTEAHPFRNKYCDFIDYEV